MKQRQLMTDQEVRDLLRRLPEHRNAQLGYAVITATGRQALAVDKTSGPGDNVGSIGIGIGASAWTATATIQANPFTAGQDPLNNGWMNIQSMRQDTGAFETTPTMTANTARMWECDVQPFQQVALNITALTGGLPLNITTFWRQNGLGITQTQAVSQSITGALTITSASATSAAVGPNGATNPVWVVDSSTGSQADGLKVTGAAAGTGVALQGITSGTNAPLLIDAAAAGLVKIGSVASTALGLQVGSSTAAAGTQLIVQSTNAAAVAFGRLGATTPAFSVDASASTCVTGFKVTAAASGSGAALVLTGGNGNENLTLDTTGTGIITIAATSTGGANVRVPVQTLAATGTAIGNAAAAKEGFTYVTGGNNAAAIILPVAGIGAQVRIVNTVGTATLQVFPQVSSQINAKGVNNVYNIPNAGQRVFTKATATLWYTDAETIV